MKKLHYILILLLLSLIILPALWGYSRSAGTSSTSSLQNGLVGYWPLDSASNRSTTVTADKTPNRNHGTSSGSPTLGGATDWHGQAGKATYLNSQYIDIGDKDQLDMGTNSFSVAAWVKPGNSANGDIISKRTSYATYVGWSFYFINTSTGFLKIASDATHDDHVAFSSSGANVWLHIVGVCNKLNNTIKTYVNGVYTGNSTSIAGFGTLSNNVTARIGYGPRGGPGAVTDMTMADIRVYNRALSTAEITQLYNSYRPKVSTGSLNSGLVGYWPLDSASNRSTTVTADKTPNRNHGTGAGSITLGGATDWHGQASRATEFDGSNDSINLGDLTYLNSVSKFSMSFWMSQDVIDQSDEFFYKDLNGSNRISISTATDGNFYVKIGSTYKYFDYSVVVSAGVWAHVVMVYDGTQVAANRVKVYINGVSQTLSGGGTIPTTTPNCSGVAAVIGGVEAIFDGKLADFRIYNRALSTAEITQLYNSNRPKISTGSLNNGLVGYWPLQQKNLKSSTTIADLTPNRNTGTLVGSPTFTTDRHNQSNKAMSFNGSSQYSQSTLTLNTSGNSVSLWFKVTSHAATQGIVSNGNTINDGSPYFILQNNNGNLRTYENSFSYSGTIESLSLDTWYHVVVTRTSTKENVYVNNVQKLIDRTIGTAGNATYFYIGTSFNTKFNGSIADVRVYNRVLSAAEVTALYNSY